MKIKKVKILSPFRGLPKDYEITFNPSMDNYGSLEPICFVGLNGTGKSNVIEVIAEIFYYLETYHKADQSSLPKFKNPFGFEMEYYLPKITFEMGRIPWDELTSKWSNSTQHPLFRIVKEKGAYPVISARIGDEEIILKNADNNRNEAVLPARVIGYSSGLNELISNPFTKIDFHYFDEFEEKAGQSNRSTLEMNRLFFMDYDSNKLITVCNFLFDEKDFDISTFTTHTSMATDFGGIFLTPLRSELKIRDLKSFSITLKLIKNPIFLPPELNVAIDNLKNCATVYEESDDDRLPKVYEFFFWVNKATKAAFRNYFKTAFDLYRQLYFLRLLNIQLMGRDVRNRVKGASLTTNISDLLPKFEEDRLSFSLNDVAFLKEKADEKVYYKQLSDGEHQLLQVLGSILLMDTPGTLFLLDEPETHYNPEWRSKFVSLLSKCLNNSTREQDIIITSHSPFIVSDCREKNVFVFSKDDVTGESIWESPGFNTFGASVNLITMKVFKKTVTISDLSNEILKAIKNKLTAKEINKETAIHLANELGDSLEKTLFFDFINKMA